MISPTDAGRTGGARLREKVAQIDDRFIEETLSFLAPIARRLAETVGAKVLENWLGEQRSLPMDWTRDQEPFKRLQALATFMESRPRPLRSVTQRQYEDAFQNQPP